MAGRSSAASPRRAAGPLPASLAERVADLQAVTLAGEVPARFTGRWTGADGAPGVPVMITKYPDTWPVRTAAWRQWRRADPTLVAQLIYTARKDGCAFEVVRCSAAGTLRDLLRSAPGPLPAETVSLYVEQLAVAIDYVHRSLGLVHGAVSPDVIMVDGSRPRRLQVGGLGLAITHRAAATVRPTNSTGLWLDRVTVDGTAVWENPPASDLPYLSPERFLGERRGEGDYWALGVILAELLLGACPFSVSTDDKGWAEHFQLIAQGHIDASTYLNDTAAGTRLLSLINGLLTRDAAIRWNSAKVFEWLDGADPEVFRPVVQPDAVGARQYDFIASTATTSIPGGGDQVFISYSRENVDYAARLDNLLAAHGIPVWLDQAITAGDLWWPTIQEQLSRSSVVVVLMTPAADTSPWVAREIDQAEAQGKLIMPLLLHGARFNRLSNIQFENVSDGRMPSDAFVARIRAHVRGGRCR